jgi:hypothetical protein
MTQAPSVILNEVKDQAPRVVILRFAQDDNYSRLGQEILCAKGVA